MCFNDRSISDNLDAYQLNCIQDNVLISATICCFLACFMF